MGCLIFKKKISTKPLKVFFIYTSSQVLFSALIYILVYYLETYSGYILALRFHLLTEYTLLSCFFYFILKRKLFRLIIIFLVIPFYLFTFFEYQTNGNNLFNSYPTILEFFIFILFAIFFLFELLNEVNIEPLSNNIIFWINVGLFVYFCGNFFYILLVQNSINADKSVQNKLIIIYSIVSILKNILLSIGFIFSQEPSPKNNSDSFPKDLNLDMF